MIVAVLADTHFGVRNDHPAFAELMKKFCTGVLVPELVRRGVKRLIHLGDVFDRRKYVNIATAMGATESLFRPLRDAGVAVDVIVGNHDCYYRNTNRVNSVRTIYGDFDGVTVHESPVELDVGSCRTLLVPWVPTDDAADVARTVEASRARLCLGHLELTGFDMHRGTKCEHGADPKNFSRFERVLSGHFHTPSSAGNVDYVGAAGQYTWADYDDPRGFHFLDTESLATEFVSNPHEAFAKVHYDGTPDSRNAAARAGTAGKFVKLIVDHGVDTSNLADAVDILESTGVYGLQVVEDHRNAADVDLGALSSGVSDTLAVMMSAIEAGVQNDMVDAVKRLARELHEAALASNTEN